MWRNWLAEVCGYEGDSGQCDEINRELLNGRLAHGCLHILEGFEGPKVESSPYGQDASKLVQLRPG
jgi:hypothetical protein